MRTLKVPWAVFLAYICFFLIGDTYLLIWPPGYIYCRLGISLRQGWKRGKKACHVSNIHLSWRETWVGWRKAKVPGSRPGILSLPPRRCVTPVNTRLMDGMQIKAHTVKQAARKQAPKQSPPWSQTPPDLPAKGSPYTRPTHYAHELSTHRTNSS